MKEQPLRTAWGRSDGSELYLAGQLGALAHQLDSGAEGLQVSAKGLPSRGLRYSQPGKPDLQLPNACAGLQICGICIQGRPQACVPGMSPALLLSYKPLRHSPSAWSGAKLG